MSRTLTLFSILAVACSAAALTAAPAHAANASLQIVGGKWVLAADTTLSAGNPRPQTLTVTFIPDGAAPTVHQYAFHVESADADADAVIPSAFTPGQHGCAYASSGTDSTTLVCNLRNSSTLLDIANLRVQGGEGADSLTVFGGAVNPRNGILPVTAPVEFVGNGGNDQLDNATFQTPGTHDGGAGTDQYIGSNGAPDTFNDTGGVAVGADRVNYAHAQLSVDVSIDGVANDGRHPAGISEQDNVDFAIEEVFGGPGADTLSGSAFPNVLSGEAGADTLRGQGGGDVLDGKTGDDVLDGGLGPDTFNGGADKDTVDYSTRAQRMVATLDDVANDGNASPFSLEDKDSGLGPSDNVKSDVENLRAGPGGSGFDATAAGTVRNTLEGGAGADVFLGGNGNDVLFEGGGSGDRFDGGDGLLDRVDYSANPGDLTISLADGDPTDGAPGEADDIEVNVEEVVGGPGDDLIIGNAGANGADGGAGDDTYRLGEGSDTSLLGLVEPDPGFDTLDYSDHLGPVTVELGTGVGGAAGEDDGVNVNVERIIGTPAADTLRGNSLFAADEVFRGGGGDDIIEGRGGTDLSDYSERGGSVTFSLDGQDNDGVGGEEDRLTTIEGAIGGSGADTLTGDASANTFTGGAGADTVDGGAGADTILVRDDEADGVTCGSESDSVVADLIDNVGADCESVDKPPAPPADPPAEDPPAGDPPVGDPPAGDPPAGQPAASDPLPQPSPPSNSFRWGAITGLRRGFARMAVIVPGPGQIVARARTRLPRLFRFRVVRVTATRAGRVFLTIRPRGRAKTRLERTGRLKITVKITFTPTGGSPASRTTKLTLKLPPRR